MGKTLKLFFSLATNLAGKVDERVAEIQAMTCHFLQLAEYKQWCTNFSCSKALLLKCKKKKNGAQGKRKIVERKRVKQKIQMEALRADI